jgi:hypothetical protein
MGENIITWNVTNWVTILVMVFLGFLIVAAGVQGWKTYQAKKAA